MSMRKARNKGADTKTALTTAYARSLVQHGLRGASISTVMKGIGLTHGGFYKHYATKEALESAAIRAAFEERLTRWRAHLDACSSNAADRRSFATTYLKPEGDKTSFECPIAAMAADAARSRRGSELREVFAEGLANLLEIYELSLSGPVDKEQVLADFAMLVGAFVLSRATAGRPIADELVEAVTGRLAKTT